MPRIQVRKMLTEFKNGAPIEYSFKTESGPLPLNPLLGRNIILAFAGSIHCLACGRKTNKSYQQGYCFPCTQSLAQCDLCIVKPELCHFAKGTCREPAWGQEHCMIPHVLYVANSSGLKVGITRAHQKLTRWMDQGAVQAMSVATTQKRLDAGLLESFLKKDYADRTDWRAMLKGEGEPIDLTEIRDEILGSLPMTLAHEDIDEAPVDIRYPVLEYPKKVQSMSFDKTPRIEGTLLGIKGQYLILDKGVINMRNHSGYDIDLEMP